MQFDLASTCVGFLLGTLTGAAGGYYANKFTDRRRSKEADRNECKAFRQIATQIPEVIADMAEMLTKKPVVREFCVTGGNTLYFICPPDFTHQSGKHEDLLGKARILENHGYIVDVTKPTSNCPKFRMTEEFVTLVCKGH